MRLFAQLSLTTKALLLGVIAGIGLWLGLNNYQETRLSTLLERELAAQLAQDTEVIHRRFFLAVERNGRLATLFAALSPVRHYLHTQPASAAIAEAKPGSPPPPWVPPVRGWRGLIFPSLFMLYDPRGRLIDRWRVDPRAAIPPVLDTDPADWLRKSDGHALVTEIDGKPAVLASATMFGEDRQPLGHIALYTPLDDHFLRSSLGQDLTPNSTAVLLTGGYGGQQVWATSDPSAFPAGMPAEQLSKTHLFGGKAYFDQGDWDLQAQLAVLIPKTALAELNAEVLAHERKQRLFAAITFVTVFTGLMVFLSFRLQRVAREIEEFAASELGTPLPPSRSLDLVERLSESVGGLTREVRASREAMRLQHQMQRNADQLKILQSATDTLRVGVLRLDHGQWRAVNRAMTRFIDDTGTITPFTSCGSGELDIQDLAGHRRVFNLASLGSGPERELLLVNEVTELTVKTEELTRLALYDSLTGIPNRVLLGDRLSQAIARTNRGGPGFALLLLDLDRFKEVNDTLGHSAGDGLLAEVAYRFSQHLRAADTISRMGGDEFAVILCNTQRDRARMIAARFLEAQRQPYQIGDQQVDVGVSIGIVLCPEHGKSNDTLLARADIAMYQAKRERLGQFVYSPEIDTNSRERLSLLSELRRAITRDELTLFYQPQLDLGTLEVRSWEALVRWRHPQRGLLAPMDFIPQAEESGLIGDITRLVLRHAISDCRDWRARGLAGGVSVNLSTRDCADAALPRRVQALLDEQGLPAEALTLEITETALMQDPVKAGHLLETLDQAGIGISVDDFGTGYSSLAYLKHLPIDEIKIDQVFVRNMLKDKADAAIVHAVIGLARSLKLRVVAEGVEDHESLSRLAHLRCDVAQGFLLGRPAPIEELPQTALGNIRPDWPPFV